ncbi:gamma-glutamyl-gamma-aminobutyrate hydrolase family protein [Amycolatopsis sp. GM8]|uniref:gamma-glutamyl-gamma-aminobutyrate hydrolase family protein n=1 Tax=Amycolatopsis sp. GM8 TaxID=2896530 RepID=UPI001F1DBE55|nr:gamma-glutamyl-gamma-aminobutyrate hydrolase family protein [Amycolatopsis sp. GM8]
MRLALDVRWSGFLAACGLFAVPLPIEPDIAWSVVRRTRCVGLLLSGGNDLGSVPERDTLEYGLVSNAMAAELPVIGVCRGMQVLLSAFGGELHRVEGHVAQTHPVSTGRMVNSYHEWAAFEAPEEFLVTERCGAVVEAIRHRTAPLTGIMWHPERMSPFDEQDLAFFMETFGSSHEGRHSRGRTRIPHGSAHRRSSEVPAQDRRAHATGTPGGGPADGRRR